MPLAILPMDAVMQFAAVITIALTVMLLAARLGLPAIVGLLIAGMLIGPGGLQFLPREPVVELLGLVGLVYLMFLAGLEVDLGILRNHRHETISFGVLAFLLSIVPAIAAGFIFGLELAAAVLLGTLLSSHTLVAYPIIERHRLLHRKPIVTAIGGTLVTDTLALVLLAIVIAVIGGEVNNVNASNNLIDHGGILDIITPIAGLAALVAISLWLVPRMSRAVFDHLGGSRPVKALYVLVIVLLLAIIADLLGTEKILGAFLAGVCFNRVLKKRGELHEHVEFVGHMLFIPFFFISTGMLLELEVFYGEIRPWLIAAVLIAIVFLGKSTAAWITGSLYGYSRASRIAMIGLTVPQAAATLAVTMIAREANLFPEEIVDAVIILILITCLSGILITRRAAKTLAQVEE